MNSQLNSISNEVLNKKLDYIINSVTFIHFSMIGAGYVTTFLFDKFISNK